MNPSVIYEDAYGSVIDDPNRDLIEIRWFDATEGLDRDAFDGWLGDFAGAVEATGRSGILVDSLNFRMSPEHMDEE